MPLQIIVSNCLFRQGGHVNRAAERGQVGQSAPGTQGLRDLITPNASRSGGLIK